MGRAFGIGLPVRPINKLMYFGLSPMEQKAYYKILLQTAPNWFRRFKSKFLYGTPVIAYTIWLMKWADQKAEQVNRKQPGQFDNES